MKGIIFYLIGWVIFAALFRANLYLFEYFLKLNYYQWFIKQGAFISIITGLIYFFKAEATKESNDIGLISGHPLDFLGAHMQLLGLLFLALGSGLKGSRITKFHLFVDLIITLSIILPLAILLVGWLFVILPCQYMVYFICGAPSRLFQTSESSTLVKATSLSTKDGKAPQKTKFIIDIKTKPFEFTNALAAFILYILGQFLF